MWFLPLVGLIGDRRLIRVSLVVAGVLSLTGIPAEPGPARGAYEAMLLAVHYGGAGVMLAMVPMVVRRVLAGEGASAGAIRSGVGSPEPDRGSLRRTAPPPP